MSQEREIPMNTRKEFANNEERQTYFKSHRVRRQKKAGGCVDERLFPSGNREPGYKLAGGSDETHDLMLVACHRAGIDINNLPKAADGSEVNLIDLNHKLYQSNEAQELQIEPGVHIDDEHGHITSKEELAGRTEGCGHDRVRGNVLKEGWGIELTTQPRNLVPLELAYGIACEVYAGNHVSGAYAVENWDEQTTLDTQGVYHDGAAAFCHDIGVVNKLKPAIVALLHSLGGQYVDAARMAEQFLTEDAQQIFRLTLKNLGGPWQDVDKLG